MFNFIKKSSLEKEEKEKRKREKESKKKRERVGMTAEELLRLDEVRRSLKIRTKRKEREKLPSGITADYRENFFGDLEQDIGSNRSGSLPGHVGSNNSVTKGDVLTQSDSSETSLNSLQNHAPSRVLPPLPPRPPKRGILKGSKSSINNCEFYDNCDLNNTSILVRNTLQNEIITYQNLPSKSSSDISQSPETLKLSMQFKSDLPTKSNYIAAASEKNYLPSTVLPSSSAENLTETSNSSFAASLLPTSPTDDDQGCFKKHHYNSATEKMLSNLPLPGITPIQLPKPRDLVIYRTSKGDFGFQLRRAIITDKLSNVIKKTVIFAEPGSMKGNKNESGLLPGDILLEVNGIQVQDKSREEIIDLIKSSKASVAVKVQPIPELSELTRRSGINGQYVVLDDSNIQGGTLKRSGSLRFRKATAKTDEDLADEKTLLNSEKLWLVHRKGFTSVKRLPDPTNSQSDCSKVRVKVDKTNEVIDVDEDDLENANPRQLDQIEDVCQLPYINESSVLHVLRQRYGNNLIHTYAAGNLIVLNPQCTLSIYNEKVASLFRGCKSEDMPPHIYAIAQTTYQSMLSSRKDQSIVLLGRSGSGKTHNFKHILNYLLHSAGSHKVLTLEKLNALSTVLEAFGNARTCLNVSATRCTNLMNLDFDQTGQIASLSVQMLMLEKYRVIKRPEGEGTFNVFHWLLEGADSSLAKQLLLDTTMTECNNLFISSMCKDEDRQRATMEFTKLTLAFQVLGISDREGSVIWSLLAAIFHLGSAGAVKVGTNKWQFADAVAASRACRLLGTTAEELAQELWSGSLSPSKAPSPTDKDKVVGGVEALEGFVIGLYSEIVNSVNNLINRCLTSGVHGSVAIIVVDSPGLQMPESCGQQRGATFNELCHNYVQERFHLFFHNISLLAPSDRYIQEHVDVNTEEIQSELSLPGQLVSVLDKSPPSGVLKTSQADLSDVDRRGLLWLLDEENLYPNSSDESFVARLLQHYSGKDYQTRIRKYNKVNHFVVEHLQGTSPVVYNGTGFLKATKENSLSRAAVNFLQESAKENIRELFLKGKNNLLAPGGEGSQTLRRISSIRRTCTSAIKRKSFGLQVKFTMDGILETLRRTRIRFVFCMLAQHNAGNTDVIPAAAAAGENVLNVPLLRSQMRGAKILPAVRLFKQGFPECFPHSEFKRRFKLLAPASGGFSAASPKATVSPEESASNLENFPKEALNEAHVVEEMLLHMDVDTSGYRIGLTQVFFRPGVLAELESQRDEKLADTVVRLQSRCRGYLARKKLAKLKVQDLAVRCIQKNVRKLMQVREWPWWRLYVKITPLLNVHRTEQELTVKIQELEALKALLEKVEAERSQLKMENDKLETKLSEMTMDLSEERASGTLQADRLEAETSERVRLEQELLQMQCEKKNLQQASERLEMELFYAKADINGLSQSEGDLEDGGGDAALYKNKCERAMRELEFTRRRLQQQHEDDLEQLVALKKQLEKKLANAYEEVDEQRQVANQWKRKVQKLQSEMNDLRLLLEVQSSRNNLLEKKQRKFDSEVLMLQEELRAEKNQKDHLSREKDIALAEKYAAEQNLSSVRLELELKDEKLSELTKELEELSRGGGSEQEMVQLRKTKHDLEIKLKEQEEELDELAGQISMLEGNKLRLEMSLESLRKEHRREMAQRDDELDEARSNAQKKIKVLECQLESEHEERTLLVREKHELESRLADAEERGRHAKAADEDALTRARRDLKKTKALLRDTQVMLDKAKKDSPSKAALRALKNQLEDAELARASAVKAKQSIDCELTEVNGLLEEALKGKGDAENRYQAALREVNALRTQVDENEEELGELLKKYRQIVQQLSAEQMANQETAGALAEAEAERQSLRDQLSELTARLEAVSVVDPINGLAQKKLEIRIKELESRLDLEQTTRARLEVQIARLKENVEKLNEECSQARAKEQAATDASRKLQRSLREVKENLAKSQAKEQESSHKRKDLEKRLEAAEQEASTARTDLRLALKRIEDLQVALSGEIGSDSELTDSEEEEDNSEDESLTSQDVVSTVSSASRTTRTCDLTLK